MRYCLLLFLPTWLHSQTIQLAPPQFVGGEVFFQGRTYVSLEFAMDNACIHYTINKAPDIRSARYSRPLEITESVLVKAISSHPDFIPSAVAAKHYILSKHRPDTMLLYHKAHEKYAGQGAKSLYDLKKGSAELKDGNWLGFLGDTAVVVEAVFMDKTVCTKLVISTLSDVNSWILPFQKVIIEGKDKRGDWLEIGRWDEESPLKLSSGESGYSNYLSTKLKRLNTQNIRITFQPIAELPPGHPGAGTPAWLFLDEIIFQ